MSREAKYPTTPVYIDSTYRAYDVSVQALTTADGYYEFGINSDEINVTIVRIMEALSGCSADIAIASIGITFVLIVRRWGLRVCSYLGFVEQYLKARDEKTAIVGMQNFLRLMFKEHVRRKEKVQFNRSVRIL